MRNRDRNSMRWTARTLLATFWLLISATCAVPECAQEPDAPRQNGGASTASDNPARGPSASDADASADPESMFKHFKSTRFWLSGQTNFIFQALPEFHADYSGLHSLGPD